MKLSDYQDEQALDILADLIDPATEIFSDQRLARIFRNNGKPTEAVKIMLKDHKQSVMQVLAALDGVDVKDYHCNVLTLPIRLLEILNDEGLVSFFSSQALSTEQSSSGAPMGNTKAKKH